MKRRLPIKRAVATVVAVALLATGCYFRPQYLDVRREMLAGERDKLLDMEVDLSSPGEYTGKLVQTCAMSHGQNLVLHLGHEVATAEAAAALLAGLDAQFTVFRNDG